jgi:hypothetical protein
MVILHQQAHSNKEGRHLKQLQILSLFTELLLYSSSKTIMIWSYPQRRTTILTLQKITKFQFS